jgi:hypothetical protein
MSQSGYKLLSERANQMRRSVSAVAFLEERALPRCRAQLRWLSGFPVLDEDSAYPLAGP